MFDLIFSVLIAIILAYVIFFSINIKIIYRGPNSKDIKNKIYPDHKTGKCYILEPIVCDCPRNF